MMALYQGKEVFFPKLNGEIIRYIVTNVKPEEDNETTAVLGTAVLGKMLLGTGG